jgi:hypothetical protein
MFFLATIHFNGCQINVHACLVIWAAGTHRLMLQCVASVAIFDMAFLATIISKGFQINVHADRLFELLGHTAWCYGVLLVWLFRYVLSHYHPFQRISNQRPRLIGYLSCWDKPPDAKVCWSRGYLDMSFLATILFNGLQINFHAWSIIWAAGTHRLMLRCVASVAIKIWPFSLPSFSTDFNSMSTRDLLFELLWQIAKCYGV